MAHVTAFANQKGGVGKTTASISLAAGLAARGFSVLAIDMDPQGDFSVCLGVDNENEDSLYEVFRGRASLESAAQSAGSFEVVPGNRYLANADAEFSQTGRELMLKLAIEPVQGKYDYIVVDTPPNLGVLTVNAMAAATDIVVPVTPRVLSAAGLQNLLRTYRIVKEFCNSGLVVAGVLLNEYSQRTRMGAAISGVASEMAAVVGEEVRFFEATIRSAEAVAQSQGNTKDIFSFSPNSPVAGDYSRFVDEYLSIQKAQSNGA